jgi:hypothetical protein
MSTNETAAEIPQRSRGRWAKGLVVVGTVAAVGLGGTLAAQAAAGGGRPTMPTSAAVEAASGVQLTRVSLAADGGLLDVRYVVLDSSKARKWAADTKNPPVIKNERNSRLFDRVAAMRDSHELRNGQTYYLIYLNSAGGVKRGDTVDLTIAGTTLTGIPVE